MVAHEIETPADKSDEANDEDERQNHLQHHELESEEIDKQVRVVIVFGGLVFHGRQNRLRDFHWGTDLDELTPCLI